MLSVHHFLSRLTDGDGANLASRLNKLSILAGLLGAAVHDYAHPGTSNAHEVKVLSQKAIQYSDSSVLERHHLASAFALIFDPALKPLASLSSDDIRTVRSLVIEMVLFTDLTRHFEFVKWLSSLASVRGKAQFDASTKIIGAETAAASSAMQRRPSASVMQRRPSTGNVA
eukprot:6059235-Prymnesium_polylepis.1